MGWDQAVLNRFLRSGKWLRQPLMLRGIVDPDEQRCIVRAMIHQFNEMMIGVVESKQPGSENYRFPNVFHIDCRGAVAPADGWYDELHPKSEYFEKIARAYQDCIDYDQDKKRGKPPVYFADDERNFCLMGTSAFLVQRMKSGCKIERWTPPLCSPIPLR